MVDAFVLCGFWWSVNVRGGCCCCFIFTRSLVWHTFVCVGVRVYECILLELKIDLFQNLTARGRGVIAKILTGEAEVTTCVNERASISTIEDQRGTLWLSRLLHCSSARGFFVGENFRSVASETAAATATAARQWFAIRLRVQKCTSKLGDARSCLYGSE